MTPISAMATAKGGLKAVVALTPGGVLLGERICAALGQDYHLYRPRRLSKGDQFAFVTLADFLPRLFRRGTYEGIICIMACGIVFRLLGPFVQSKDKDPALVVADEKGDFFISLLSGHLGGGNDLARTLAAKMAGVPVVTTATDVRGLQAVDQLARDFGLAVEPVEGIKDINSRLLEGYPVPLYSNVASLPPGFPPSGYTLLPFTELGQEEEEIPSVLLTEKILTGAVPEKHLFLRPLNLVAGVGCRRGVSAQVIKEAVLEVFEKNQLSIKSLVCLATVDLKEDEAGLGQAAREMAVPLKIVSRREIKGLDMDYTGSEFVLKQTGVKGVCEPTAILAAGRGKIVVKKTARQGVSVAVARVKSMWWG